MKGKSFLVISLSLLIALLGAKIGLTVRQAIALGVFFMSVAGTLFFWEARLNFVFFGAGVLLMSRVIDLENFIKFASLDVILFLIGMMILVGMLNEAGLFFWMITKLLRVRNLNGTKLFILIMVVSAALSSLMDEVTSIIIMTKVIIEISDFFDIDPIPILISSIFATNIGSSGTVLGNPIGVLIAARGGLTFENFIFHALPVTLLVLVVVIITLSLWFRKYLSSINKKVSAIKENRFFLSLISIPPDRKVKISALIFGATLLVIALHHRFELFFNIEENTLLLMFPIISAGIALFYRSDKMRHYVEHEVEWHSILFFLFLFAQAGAIRYSGISDFFAEKFINTIGNQPKFFLSIILYSSGFLSSILDNTVVVASYVPMLLSLESLGMVIKPLWWALLFGACYGGNITVIGSTANIVAMDILGKRKNIKIIFLTWLKVGLVVGALSMIAAHVLLLILNF